MLQFVIIARDGNDTAAPERRRQVRPTHLAGARTLKESNHFIIGGATLDEAGQMTGSVMIVQFETQEAFDAWLETEPYINGNVWQQIEVRRFKVADV